MANSFWLFNTIVLKSGNFPCPQSESPTSLRQFWPSRYSFRSTCSCFQFQPHQTSVFVRPSCLSVRPSRPFAPFKFATTATLLKLPTSCRIKRKLFVIIIACANRHFPMLSNWYRICLRQNVVKWWWQISIFAEHIYYMLYVLAHILAIQPCLFLTPRLLLVQSPLLFVSRLDDFGALKSNHDYVALHFSWWDIAIDCSFSCCW